MSIINVMWSGGSPFTSVHKVHQQILSQVAPGTSVDTWLLKDKSVTCLKNIGEVRAWGLSSRLLKGRGIWVLAAPWLRGRFRKALAQSDARLMLLDGLGVARVLLPVLRSFPHVRVVVLFHGATRLHAKDKRLLNMFSSEQLTLCAVSNTLADSIATSAQLPVASLRCTLNLDAFKSRLLPREQARQQLAISSTLTQVFGAVGRLVPTKGFDCLIEAFALTLERHPNRLLMIFGEGGERDALQAKIHTLGLQDKILLPGHKSNIASLYRAFDWVLIPSRAEGLGLIVQEAVIAGVPILASDLPVFHEQLGPAGHYVPVDDVQAWVAVIESTSYLVADDIAARQYAALAPEQAWRCFSQACDEVLSARL